MTAPDPAAELREAVRRLRELAVAATPGRWQEMCLGSEGCMVINDGHLRDRKRVARFGQKEWKADHADAEYVASMQPAVALALADWLEATAKQADDEIADLDGPFCHRCGAHLKCPDPRECCGVVLGRCHCWDGALATARAYLGTDAR